MSISIGYYINNTLKSSFSYIPEKKNDYILILEAIFFYQCEETPIQLALPAYFLKYNKKNMI